MRYCIECGTPVGEDNISRFSMTLVDTDIVSSALLLLDGRDILCIDCEYTDIEWLEEPDEAAIRTSSIEEDYGEWSFRDIDEARQDWINLNW